jgi:hypothetical protein
MMYLSKYFILAFVELNEILFQKGLITALKREWDNAIVMRMELIKVHLNPGYTIETYV